MRPDGTTKLSPRQSRGREGASLPQLPLEELAGKEVLYAITLTWNV